MRPSAYLSLCLLGALTLVATGCSSNNTGKIEGTSWACQQTTIKGNTLPAGVVKLDFSKSGTFVYTVGPTIYNGKYSLLWGDMVYMTFDKEISGSKAHTQTIRINGSTMQLIDLDGTTIPFNKVQ